MNYFSACMYIVMTALRQRTSWTTCHMLVIINENGTRNLQMFSIKHRTVRLAINSAITLAAVLAGQLLAVNIGCYVRNLFPVILRSKRPTGAAGNVF